MHLLTAWFVLSVVGAVVNVAAGNLAAACFACSTAFAVLNLLRHERAATR